MSYTKSFYTLVAEVLYETCLQIIIEKIVFFIHFFPFFHTNVDVIHLLFYFIFFKSTVE